MRNYVERLTYNPEQGKGIFTMTAGKVYFAILQSDGRYKTKDDFGTYINVEQEDMI